MAKNMALIFLLFLLFTLNTCKVPRDEIEKLKSKYTKKLSFPKDLDSFKNMKQSSNLKGAIKYDPDVIDGIIEQYSFPSSYNFFDDTGAEPIIKDQASCGCCWSFAATTSLAYRYFKKRKEGEEQLDLSPQNGLSCYLRNCDSGNFLIDSSLNLLKNGTVTEKCEPFVSGDGENIPDCPSQCEDGSEYKKYYAKDAYLTEDYLSANTYYEIVTVILDQLTSEGPLVTGIDVYKDFMDLHKDAEKCKQTIYAYDGKSQYMGGHAVTIVGYGKSGSRYYWIIQNSWGDVCDHGFIKVEFGQIGVEAVSFVSPYIPDESVKKEVKIDLDSLSGNCTLKVKCNSSQLANWDNPLEISFANEKSKLANKRTFNYFCNNIGLPQGEKSVCYFEVYNSYFMPKGNYKFNSSQSLGVENTFDLTTSLKEKSFYFYGENFVTYIYDQVNFISEEGSSILLDHIYYNEEELPSIYPTPQNKNALKDCKPITIGEDTLAFCKIKKDEIDYFNDFSTQKQSPLCFYAECGTFYTTGTIGYKLDKNLYPVFKVKKLIVPSNGFFNNQTNFVLVFDVEGSLENFKSPNIFYGFIEIEKDKKNISSQIGCVIGLPFQSETYSTSVCLPLVQSNVTFDNVYLYQYYFTVDLNTPYEVYFSHDIKAEKQFVPSSANLINISLYLILCLILLF